MNMKIDDMSTDTIKKYLEGREEEDMKKDRKKIYYTSLHNPEGWEMSNLTKDELRYFINSLRKHEEGKPQVSINWVANNMGCEE